MRKCTLTGPAGWLSDPLTPPAATLSPERRFAFSGGLAKKSGLQAF
jgi:hypothetical protein